MMSDPTLLKGIIPVLLTPLTENGDIDETGFAKLIEFLLGKIEGGPENLSEYFREKDIRNLRNLASIDYGGVVSVLNRLLSCGDEKIVQNAAKNLSIIMKWE